MKIKTVRHFGQVGLSVCVWFSCKEWFIGCCFRKITEQSRKGILLFSLISLVKLDASKSVRSNVCGIPRFCFSCTAAVIVSSM